MKIFLTGATGFIGSRIMKQLIENTNHDLLVLIMSADDEPEFIKKRADRIKVVRGSLPTISEWGDSVIEWKPDAVINMAWEGIPKHTTEISMRNFENCMKLVELTIKTSAKKFIGAGSCWEYGTELGEQKEDSPVYYRDTFTSVKNSLHMLGRSLMEENGKIFIWPRFFYVFGTGQKPTSLIPTIISSIKDGKTPDIRTPDSENDFVYVDDVARSVLVLLDKCEESGIYNVGTGKTTSVRRIIEYIFDKLKLGEAALKPKTDEVKVKYYANYDKIKKYGWEPKFSIEDGIDEMLKDRGLLK